MIKKEPHRRICTRFSGHRFKIEKWVSIMDASLNSEGGIHFDRFEAGGKLYVLRLGTEKRGEGFDLRKAQIFVECAVEIH